MTFEQMPLHSRAAQEYMMTSIDRCTDPQLDFNEYAIHPRRVGYLARRLTRWSRPMRLPSDRYTGGQYRCNGVMDILLRQLLYYEAVEIRVRACLFKLLVPVEYIGVMRSSVDTAIWYDCDNGSAVFFIHTLSISRLLVESSRSIRRLMHRR